MDSCLRSPGLQAIKLLWPRDTIARLEMLLVGCLQCHTMSERQVYIFNFFPISAADVGDINISLLTFEGVGGMRKIIISNVCLRHKLYTNQRPGKILQHYFYTNLIIHTTHTTGDNCDNYGVLFLFQVNGK